MRQRRRCATRWSSTGRGVGSEKKVAGYAGAVRAAVLS